MRHAIYSKDSTVHLVTGTDKIATFREAVDRSGFLGSLDARWQATGRPKEDFAVAVKPNIMTAAHREDASTVYTDPEVVEELLRTMRDAGFRRLAVVESQNVYNYAYHGRTVPAVADMCGYTGQGYDIVDLTEDVVPYDYGGALGQHLAGRAWLEADYRISFAKNKTHAQAYYTACLKNVFGCLPVWDKMRAYHGKDLEFYQAAVIAAEHMPVHFGFLDAWTSGDGLLGYVRDPVPNLTRTFLASENILALDWVAGEKMRLDPLKNPVVNEAAKRWGTVNIERVGDMTPWAPWSNVPRLMVDVYDALEENYELNRFFSYVLAPGVDPRFPPVGILKRIGALLERLTEAPLKLAVALAGRRDHARRPRKGVTGAGQAT